LKLTLNNCFIYNNILIYNHKSSKTMPKYIIEREIPGVDKLEGRDRKAAALQSLRTLREIGPKIQWVHSYISDGRTHCVYVAENEELIHEHAQKSGSPVTNIYEVEYIMEPITAEG